MRRLAVVVALLGLLAFPAAASVGASQITVFAASSLTDVFPKIDPAARYSIGGSDQLAFEIAQGAPADVFAAASPKYPEQLYRQGLVQKPIAFATNSLILLLPKSNPAHIRSVFDLTKPGVKVVIAQPSVPVGSYTLTVLKNLGITSGVMKNVVSQESDVKGVVGKVALGEADAGFVYKTDARPVRGKVKTIGLRASAQPRVVYEVAVVKSSKHLKAAYRYVTQLVRPRAQNALYANGFGRRPRAK